MSNIEQQVKKIVAEQLGVSEAEVKNESSFQDDLGADSLDTVELVMALEEAFCCVSAIEAVTLYMWGKIRYNNRQESDSEPLLSFSDGILPHPTENQQRDYHESEKSSHHRPRPSITGRQRRRHRMEQPARRQKRHRPDYPL